MPHPGQVDLDRQTSKSSAPLYRESVKPCLIAASHDRSSAFTIGPGSSSHGAERRILKSGSLESGIVKLRSSSDRKSQLLDYRFTVFTIGTARSGHWAERRILKAGILEAGIVKLRSSSDRKSQLLDYRFTVFTIRPGSSSHGAERRILKSGSLESGIVKLRDRIPPRSGNYSFSITDLQFSRSDRDHRATGPSGGS